MWKNIKNLCVFCVYVVWGVGLEVFITNEHNASLTIILSGYLEESCLLGGYCWHKPLAKIGGEELYGNNLCSACGFH
jgi:hypothetical protein